MLGIPCNGLAHELASLKKANGIYALVFLPLWIMGCAVSDATGVGISTDLQASPSVTNQRGTAEAAAQVIEHEVDQWMNLLRVSDDLIPGMRAGIPEPGSYLAEDFDLSTELPIQAQGVIRYLERSIRSRGTNRRRKSSERPKIRCS